MATDEVREPIRSGTWLYECPTCGCQEQEGGPCPMADDEEHHPDPDAPMELRRREYIPLDFYDRIQAALDRHRAHHYPSGKVTNPADRTLYAEVDAMASEFGGTDD